MIIAKKIVVALLAGLLGVIAVSGCEAQTCDDPCEIADNCIDVSGTYDPVVIQVSVDDCDYFYGGGGASVMMVTATPSDTKTDLTISFAYSSLIGELCNTVDTAQPRKFGFATINQVTDGSNQQTLNVSGDFIDTVAGIQVCGAIFYTENSSDSSCTTQASFYSSTTYCN